MITKWNWKNLHDLKIECKVLSILINENKLLLKSYWRN